MWNENGNVVYEIVPEFVVHETDEYAVDTGPYPGEQLDCYRVWNKRTSILEYAHSVFFYATQWADEATSLVQKNQSGISELPDPAEGN